MTDSHLPSPPRASRGAIHTGTVRLPGVRALALTCAVNAIAFLGIAVLVRGRWSPLIDLDARIERWVHRQVNGMAWLEFIGRVLAVVGGWPVTAPLMVVAFIVLLRRRQVAAAILVVVSGVGGTLIAEIAKSVVDRPRPVWPDPIIVASRPAFPSGHAVSGICVFACIGCVVWLLGPTRWTRVAAAGGWSLGLAIGISRVVMGVHWPSDVLAGWLLGLAWLSFTAAVVVSRRRRFAKTSPSPAR